MTDTYASYGDSFYSAIGGSARQSATKILPIVLDLIKPSRAVDVGCGTGAWLKVLSDATECEILGVDGDYLPRHFLEIPEDRFLPRDLGQSLSLNQAFDLAISVEVAEHLPRTRAAGFVRDLTELAPAVLFSAAVPAQGGIEHINEQWQSYWIDQFAGNGFETWDVIRPAIWDDKSIAYWYRQNMFLFVDPRVHGKDPRLKPSIADAVHPEMLRFSIEAAQPPSLRSLLPQLPLAARRSLTHHASLLRSRFRP
jgi:SAM-dependent methyltransferase